MSERASERASERTIYHKWQYWFPDLFHTAGLVVGVAAGQRYTVEFYDGAQVPYTDWSIMHVAPHYTVVKDISFTLFLFSPSFFLSILLPPFLPPTLSLTTQAFLPREEVYWLPQDKHEKDVQYLQHQEKTWVGQATVARRDTDGLYYPGRTSPVQPQQLKVYWSAYGSIVGLHTVVLSVCIQ